VNTRGEISSDKYRDDWTADYCDTVRYAVNTLLTIKPVQATRVRNTSMSTFTGL